MKILSPSTCKRCIYMLILFVVLLLGFVHVFTVVTRPSKWTGWGSVKDRVLCLREAYLQYHSYHGLRLGFFLNPCRQLPGEFLVRSRPLSSKSFKHYQSSRILSLILRRSRTGTVWFYTSTSNKRAARTKLYTKSLTRDLKLMYSRFTLVRISTNL